MQKILLWINRGVSKYNPNIQIFLQFGYNVFNLYQITILNQTSGHLTIDTISIAVL